MVSLMLGLEIGKKRHIMSLLLHAGSKKCLPRRVMRNMQKNSDSRERKSKCSFTYFKKVGKSPSLVLHVGRPVQEGSHPGDVEHELLPDLLPRHDQEEALQVVWGDLVEDHLHVEGVFQAEAVVPDGAAEDQVVDGAVALELCLLKKRFRKW